MNIITGASGHTGGAIAELLLNAGQPVTALRQAADKLAGLAQRGAKTLSGDVRDLHVARTAFAGATAAFVMIPSDYAAPDFRAYQNAVIDGAIAGLLANQVPYVVTLSTVGADLADDSGVLLGLHDMEQKFRTQLPAANVLHLRVGLLFENSFSFIPVIRHAGVVGGFPIRGEIKIPMVATQDIAAVAAQRLQARDFQGHGHAYVLGPRDLSFSEMAAIIGQAIERPELVWVDFSAADAKGGLLQAGFSASAADAMLGLADCVNDGRYFTGDLHRTPQNSTPTSFEDFVGQLAAAYHG